MDDQIAFRDRPAFREWLQAHHDKPDGVWLVFYRGDRERTVSYADALEEALCFGWIDSLVKRVDDERYLRKFTPRRKGSQWSEKNRAMVAELVEKGLMTEWGMAAVDRARADGTWDGEPYLVVTDEHIEGLAAKLSPYPEAYASYVKLSRSMKREYAGFYYDARKEDTRKRRLAKIVELIRANKRLM